MLMRWEFEICLSTGADCYNYRLDNLHVQSPHRCRSTCVHLAVSSPRSSAFVRLVGVRESQLALRPCIYHVSVW
uniref:AT25392p n=1 Tax=Drosophila melanogaster TaxID=7227 RepID=Q8T961_DROME|nr:AT25392p [Drosophila melanogaster]